MDRSLNGAPTAPPDKSVPGQHTESQRSISGGIKLSERSATIYLDGASSTHLKVLNNLGEFTE